MEREKEENRLPELLFLAVDILEAAITIIDAKGTILYYNASAAKILDRKPEYIGRDAHLHHKKPSTNRRFDLMLQEFSEGRTEPFVYEANPYGSPIVVRLTPLIKEGRFLGCLQSVRLKDAPSSFA